MPIKSAQYKAGLFQRMEQILPDQVIDGPVWCVEKAEVYRRKKTIFGTCPNCLRINRLDGRTVDQFGNFSGCGCFVCTSCYCPFRPHLMGWSPMHVTSRGRKRPDTTPETTLPGQ